MINYNLIEEKDIVTFLELPVGVEVVFSVENIPYKRNIFSRTLLYVVSKLFNLSIKKEDSNYYIKREKVVTCNKGPVDYQKNYDNGFILSRLKDNEKIYCILTETLSLVVYRITEKINGKLVDLPNRRTRNRAKELSLQSPIVLHEFICIKWGDMKGRDTYLGDHYGNPINKLINSLEGSVYSIVIEKEKNNNVIILKA